MIKELFSVVRLSSYALLMMAFVSLVKYDAIAQSTNFNAVTAERSSITFSNLITDNDTFNMVNNQNHWNGGGVSIGDLNNDGLQDIFFTGNQVGNRLYLNEGNLQFKDISESAGIIAANGWNSGSVLVDVNDDGYLDIYVSRGGNHPMENRRNLLFINNGDLTFSEQARLYGIADSSYSIQSTFFDYDGDGDLDLYVLNNQNRSLQVNNLYFKQDISQFSNDILYENRDGQFINVSKKAGIKLENGLGLGIIASDFNNDGHQDLYVANDLMKQDYFLVNNGDGTFRDDLENSFPHISMNSMGCDAADFNNDLLLDLVVVDMFPEDPIRQKTQSGITNDHYERLFREGYYHQFVRNVLQKNLGEARFLDVGQFAGVAHTDWSWSPLFLDTDNDGDKDLIVTNSLPKDMLDSDFQKFTMDSLKGNNLTAHSRSFLLAMNKMKDIRLNNYFFRNESGKTFTKGFLNEVGVNSNGMAYGDLDNDGDLDLVLNNLDTVSFVMENIQNNRNSVRLKLEGKQGNRFAYGARVIGYSGQKAQLSELTCSRGYQSSSEPVIHFGIGQHEVMDSVIVYWDAKNCSKLDRTPTGLTKVKFGDRRCDCPPRSQKASDQFKFSEISVSHSHKENYYDDFKNEPMLIRKLSAEGPCMGVGDIDADGDEDLYIGGTESGTGAFVVQSENGIYKVVPESEMVLTKSSSKFYRDDVSCLLIDVNGDKMPDLIKVKGGNEKNLSRDMPGLECFLNDGSGKFNYSESTFPLLKGNFSVVCATDYNSDSWQDLFIGGRSVEGEYPITPRSYLLKNNKGKFEDVTTTLGLPEHLGLVTDAKWVNLEKSKRTGLVVVGEYMEPKVFQYTGKVFKPVQQDFGRLIGMWTCIEAADLDMDGDQDLILGNMGLNTRVKASPEQPFAIYFADLDKNGSLDAIPTYFIEGREVIIPSRDLFLDQVYTMRSLFNTYSKFAAATISSISEKAGVTFSKKEAGELNHILLFNDGRGGFSHRYLPSETQACKIQDMVVEDVNSDGFLDIMFVSNDNSMHNSFGKLDGCPGMVLINSGNAEFKVEIPRALHGLSEIDARRIIMLRNRQEDSKDFFVGVNNGPAKGFRLNSVLE